MYSCWCRNWNHKPHMPDMQTEFFAIQFFKETHAWNSQRCWAGSSDCPTGATGSSSWHLQRYTFKLIHSYVLIYKYTHTNIIHLYIYRRTDINTYKHKIGIWHRTQFRIFLLISPFLYSDLCYKERRKNKNIHCPQCGKFLISKLALENHVEEFHRENIGSCNEEISSTYENSASIEISESIENTVPGYEESVPTYEESIPSNENVWKIDHDYCNGKNFKLYIKIQGVFWSSKW